MIADPKPKIVVLVDDETAPAHVIYTEPNGWYPPTKHYRDLAEALGHVDAITGLAGPSAAARRTWFVSPCDCGTDGV